MGMRERGGAGVRVMGAEVRVHTDGGGGQPDERVEEDAEEEVGGGAWTCAPTYGRAYLFQQRVQGRAGSAWI